MEYEQGKIYERLEQKLDMIIRKLYPELFTEDKGSKW